MQSPDINTPSVAANGVHGHMYGGAGIVTPKLSPDSGTPRNLEKMPHLIGDVGSEKKLQSLSQDVAAGTKKMVSDYQKQELINNVKNLANKFQNKTPGATGGIGDLIKKKAKPLSTLSY